MSTGHPESASERRVRDARAHAARQVELARKYRREYETGYALLDRASDDLARMSARHLVGHIHGGDRDPYGAAFEQAAINALAAEMLRTRALRIIESLQREQATS